MIEKVELLPAQKCFPINGFILCNWVNHPKKKGYGILSLNGWIRLQRKLKTKSLVSTKDLEEDKSIK